MMSSPLAVTMTSLSERIDHMSTRMDSKVAPLLIIFFDKRGQTVLEKNQ